MSQRDSEASTDAVQRVFEQLLGAAHAGDNAGDNARRQAAKQLLSDFTARDTHASIAQTYSSKQKKEPAKESDAEGHDWDWDWDALQELAHTGQVSAIDGPTTPQPSSGLSSDNDVSQLANERFMLYSSTGAQTFADIPEAIATLQQQKDGWLDITAPTDRELDYLGQTMHVHPLTIEDMASAGSEQDKLERHKSQNYAFLTYRTPSSTLCILVFASHVITVHGLGLSPEIRATLARLLGLRHAVSCGFIAYALVDAVTDTLAMAMRQTEKTVQKVDLSVMMASGSQTDVLRQIGSARRELLTMLQMLAGKSDVIRGLNRLVSESLSHHFQDINDQLAALIGICTQCELVLARAHANYMAQLSLGLSRATVGAGAFANRWAVLAGVLLPLQIAAGFFGQNVLVPWTWDQENKIHDNVRAWLGILGFMLGFLLLVVALLWRRGAL
ncbi:CorA metal ion transporter [Coemansia sp. RSA 1722]|nr:CorA metal ion transporter [Coemansia sp. RSA 486]KAJ2596205.1 CorA metal ion transporter [Coemansia sp. RSA 1722]KAJ2634092.1 CorA metal ion transporter [Coemansia sp. RSA 1286]